MAEALETNFMTIPMQFMGVSVPPLNQSINSNSFLLL